MTGLPPALSSPVPICTPGWRDEPKNATPCPHPGLETGPLNPEASALTALLLQSL